MAITLTERAAQEIKALLQEQGIPNASLRVWVAGGGCSGLQYQMAYMDGSSIDYVEDMLGGGFRIDNPNAIATCGCGSSFQAEGVEGVPGCGCRGCGYYIE
jgi:iron-sulfur cluster assembly protein